MEHCTLDESFGSEAPQFSYNNTSRFKFYFIVQKVIPYPNPVVWNTLHCMSIQTRKWDWMIQLSRTRREDWRDCWARQSPWTQNYLAVCSGKTKDDAAYIVSHWDEDHQHLLLVLPVRQSEGCTLVRTGVQMYFSGLMLSARGISLCLSTRHILS